MRTAALAAALLALAACSRPAPENAAGNAVENAVPAEEAPAEVNATAATADDLVGRWTGVEGMYLVIAKGLAPGEYKLEMQYDLDNKASGLDGMATSDGIAFARKGEALILRRTGGAATGLKYLDGKKDCLTVKEGEGYCRD